MRQEAVVNVKKCYRPVVNRLGHVTFLVYGAQVLESHRLGPSPRIPPPAGSTLACHSCAKAQRAGRPSLAVSGLDCRMTCRTSSADTSGLPASSAARVFTRQACCRTAAGTCSSAPGSRGLPAETPAKKLLVLRAMEGPSVSRPPPRSHKALTCCVALGRPCQGGQQGRGTFPITQSPGPGPVLRGRAVASSADM